MIIDTIDSQTFYLKNNENQILGSLIYLKADFSEATIETDKKFVLQLISVGTWTTYLLHTGNNFSKNQITGN